VAKEVLQLCVTHGHLKLPANPRPNVAAAEPVELLHAAR
jgi:hypothetical protein